MKNLFISVIALLPTPALAHSSHEISLFSGGLTHPVSGTDHLLAMIALGLLAAQIGGRAIWALPCAFVGTMIVGGIAGYAGIGLAAVEPMILASVIILGALVAMAVRLPFGIMIPTVALFGFAHGWAHGAEGPANGLLTYAAGFTIATTALHLVGIGIGALLSGKALLRGVGGGTALAGLALVLGG